MLLQINPPKETERVREKDMDEFFHCVHDHECLFFIRTVCLAVGLPLFFFILHTILSLCYVSPLRAYRKLRKNGFTGPPPSFPLGNITEMRESIRKNKEGNMAIEMKNKDVAKGVDLDTVVSHDIHSTVFPYFSKWTASYGKVFVYWVGTEPFLHIADPEFLKQMSSGVTAKHWGKPSVFMHDRTPMFGYNGLLMVEGDDWVRHRHTITPAFSPLNIKGMAPTMVDTVNNMMNKWSNLISLGKNEIKVDRDITITAAEIIAKTIFGIDNDNGRLVFEKLGELQVALFRSDRLVGVPFSRVLYMKQTLEARRLGKEIDELLVEIITLRRNRINEDEINGHKQDLLGIMLSNKEKQLTTNELVDECKTFFFGGHETTALALTWTLLLLALNPEWQHQLREEIKQVMGDGALDPNMLVKLHKMGWVMNEVLRLYPSAPNAQRQAREDIVVNVGECSMTIPCGTNMWIDIVGMHHDPSLWGEDVNEFKPERFRDDPIHGGCKHKMGFLPFGFGGRMCVGRNLTMLEYRIVLTLILTRFSLSLSPNYSHSPTIMLSLRPNHGLPLILQPI